MATINPLQPPVNYAMDVQSPFEAALGGFKLGAGVAEVEAARAAKEKAQAGQTALTELFKNPDATAADYARVTAFLPKDQAAIVTQGFEAQTKEQQQRTLRDGTQVYLAIKSGNLPVAVQRLTEQAAALRTSGKVKEAQGFDDLLGLIRLNPTGAQTSIALTIAGLPGGKEFLEIADKALSTQRTEALQPSVLAKAVADADAAVADAISKQATAKNAPEKAAADAAKAKADAEKAEVDADFARANATLDVQKKRTDITKTEADILIAKEDNRIKALVAAEAKETNEVRRDEIRQRREDATEKRDQAKRDQKSLLGGQVSGIDNFLNTAIRAANTPKNIREGASGPITSRFIPTTLQDTADYEALIETLGAQAFLAQIPLIKGTGNLTEKEGDKLQASLQNLSLKQSDARLQENLKEAVRLLTKARENIITRSGTTTAPPDTPAATQVEVVTPSGTFKFANQAAADAFKKRAGIK